MSIRSAAGCIKRPSGRCSGCVVKGATLSLEPCIPAVWPEFSLDWKVGKTRYRFTVSNPEHHSQGIASATLDGAVVDRRGVPVLDNGDEHDVAILLGVARPADVPPAAQRLTNA